MKNWLKFFILKLVLNLLNYSLCLASQPPQGLIRQGNKLYKQGKIEEAIQKYNEAELKAPDSDIINFNLGAAYYKKGDYQKAIEHFTKALVSEKRSLESDALYNIGNAKYKLGKLKENTQLSLAADLMRESLEYYKRALELNPKNKDARFNYEVVEKELKALLDKLQKTPSSSKGGSREDKDSAQGQKSGQGETSESKDSSGKKAEEKKEAAAKEQSQKEDKEKQGEAVSSEGKKESESSSEKENFQQEPASQDNQSGLKELSPEQAQALLERYGQEDKVADYLFRRPQGPEGKVLKDW